MSRSTGISASSPAIHADPDGAILSDANGSAVASEFLPSADDDAYVASLMRPVTEPGAFAPWIAPPRAGIDGKPGNFEYVKLQGDRRADPTPGKSIGGESPDVPLPQCRPSAASIGTKPASEKAGFSTQTFRRSSMGGAGSGFRGSVTASGGWRAPRCMAFPLFLAASGLIVAPAPSKAAPVAPLARHRRRIDHRAGPGILRTRFPSREQAPQQSGGPGSANACPTNPKRSLRQGSPQVRRKTLPASGQRPGARLAATASAPPRPAARRCADRTRRGWRRRAGRSASPS